MIDYGMQLRITLNDTIGSDHAPHLKDNKDKKYPNYTIRYARCSNFNASYAKSRINNGKL